MSQRAPFDVLPTELINRILDNGLVGPRPKEGFRTYRDASDMREGLAGVASFARTCKRHGEISKPILAALRGRGYTRKFDVTENPAAYAQLILGNPNIAEREIFFSIDDPIYVGDLYNFHDMLAGSTQGSVVTQEDEGTDDEEEDREEKLLYRRSCWLSVILTQLPNLTTLILHADFAFDYDGFDDYLSLPSLERVVLWPTCGNADQDDCLTIHSFDLGDFQALFDAAPKIKSIHADSCWRCSVDLQLGNLKELHFTQSFLNVEDLENILWGRPQLRTFTYRAWEGNLDYVLGEYFGHHQAEASEAQFRGTLKRLAGSSLRTLQLGLNRGNSEDEHDGHDGHDVPK